jgi:predicted RND superfamily exporter protein
MKGLIDIILRNKLMARALILFLTLLSGYAITKVVLNADFSTYLRQDDPVVQKFNLIGEEYGSKSIGMVVIEAEDVFNTETLKLIRDLTDAYEDLDGVAYVTSLTNVLDFKKTEWGLEVGKLIQEGIIPETEEDLKRLRDYVLSREIYVKDLVSEDGKSTVIAVRLKHGVHEYAVTKEIRKLTESIAPNSDQIAYGGFPFLMYNMTVLIVQFVERLEPIMIFLMLAILFLAFRKVGGVLIPLLVVLFSVMWTVGLMSLFGISLNMLTGVAPIILVAMGSADGIHIMRRYYEKRRPGREPVDAIKETFSELGNPVIITTITTVIGFLSLLISDFSVIQQFGLVTALGVFIALVVTFLLIPVLIAFSKPKNEKKTSLSPSQRIRLLDRWAEFVFNNKAKILLFSGFIVIISAGMLTQIKKDVDWSLCLKKGSKDHRAEMLLRRDFGGTVPVQVLVRGEIKDPFTLKAMRYLERYLETIPSISETQSMASVISEMNDVVNDRYLVPESRDGVANLWFLVEGEEIVEQLTKEDATEGLIQAKLDTWDSGILANAMDDVNRFIKALPDRFVVIDLREIPQQNREVLLEIRSARIADNLMRDIVRRRIRVDREKLDAIVKDAVSARGLKEDGYDMIRHRVMTYLLSDDSEIESMSEVMAAEIARDVTEEIVRNEGIQLEQIAAIVKSKTIQIGAEDLTELGRSLEVVAAEAIGEARVAASLRKINGLLPPGAETIPDFLRDLKGDLWALNENLIALGIDEYKNLPEVPEQSKIKEFPVSFESTGLAAVLKRMEEELIPSQLLSLFLALAFVATAMGLIFRSASIGLIGVIPISLTILINFALMAYLRIGLDSFTSMVASVAIGLGIDTDVHFISSFKRELARLGDELKALKSTLSTTGVAILINALTVGLGFAVLLLAGGQHVRRFGGLVSLTMILSALFTFTVLPAVIMLVKPKSLRGENQG